MRNSLLVLTLSAACSAFVASCTSMSAPTAPSAPSPIGEMTPAPTPTPASDPAPATARYEVVFNSTWSSVTHPTDFPDSAHYSRLIGGTHSPAISFWQDGVLATEGIRRMAERGSTSPLDTEILQAIAGGTADRVISGPALDVSPGTTNMTFEISQAFPLVTLVTMIAPSPDWFVGVSGLPLFERGQWVEERRVDLHGFDAGTDSGATYRAADVETVPRHTIARLSGYPVAASNGVAPFGTFTFRRVP